MDEKDQYRTVALILLLTVIIIILLSPPDVLLQRGIMVDTTPSYTSTERSWVKTVMELGESEAIERLPLEIGEWRGYRVEVEENVIETLKPEMMMERAYYTPESPNPVWLLIIRAENRSAFHDPKICYRGSGWSVVNETRVPLTLNGSKWVSKDGGGDGGDAVIMVNRLLIEKNDRERLIMYFYLKELIFASSPEMITIVRGETMVENGIDTSERRVKNFMGEILPHLFIPQRDRGDPVALLLYRDYGLIGLLIEFLIILLPLIYLGRLLKRTM